MAGLSWRLPLRELSLRARCLCVCTCVRACVFACVRVRACVHKIWSMQLALLGATLIGLRRESGCVAAAGIGGEGMLLCVRVLRAMDFVCDAFVCAVACTVACASPTPRHFNTCHRPTTTSAAGEPTRRRRRAPLEPLLLRALKSLRAPPSWAHFSVAFSQTVDLTFPIFTKPTTMDKKWQKPS